MKYINPFDLLNIKPDKLSDLDSSVIQSAISTVFKTIEASKDGTINHEGIKLSKADCKSIFEEIDNKDEKEFHYFIFKNRDLNSFLTHGNLRFFKTYKAEDIYNLPKFLDFISPYFYFQYNKVLFENCYSSDVEKVKTIISIKPITNEIYLEKCYTSTYILFKDIINETKEFINQNTVNNNFDNIFALRYKGLDSYINGGINVVLINLLPLNFNSIRSELALILCKLAMEIKRNPYQLEKAYRIIDIAHKISTDSTTKQSINKEFDKISKEYFKALDQVSFQLSSIGKDLGVKKEIGHGSKARNQEKIFGLIFIFIVGASFSMSYFNFTIRLITLSCSTLYYAYITYDFIKRFKKYETDNTSQSIAYFTVVASCLGGFFYYPVALIFISYTLLTYIHYTYNALVLDNIDVHKNTWVHLILSLIVTVSIIFIKK